jgi:hypothetical protein
VPFRHPEALSTIIDIPGGTACASGRGRELAAAEMKPRRVVRVLECMVGQVGGVMYCVKGLGLL